jgi:RNA polymerase sigma-70 factor (ECF subfamily)
MSNRKEQLERESNDINVSSAENWVNLYGDYLFQYAMLRVRNNVELAEDLVQETFLSALKTEAKHEGKSNERTWLIAILKNKIFDHYRRNRNDLFEKSDFQNEEFIEQGTQTGAWKPEYAPQDWSGIPDQTYEQKEFISIFQKCFSFLSENIATVFTMREIDGTDTETICKDLGVSSSNVWVMLHRARTALRRCLELNWIGKHK